MAKYSHDRVVPFKGSELSKKQQVAEMFDKIARRYDFVNRFLSAGIDVRWRKKAIREVAAIVEDRRPLPPLVLDVATGTADMALLMTRQIGDVQIKGIDISAGMLEIGRQKITRQRLQ